jgi:primosomal protein N'
MANEKPNDQEIEDTNKRDDEMAEGKSPEVVAAIYSKGGQYYCAECHSELPIHQSCPNCHMEIDWDRLTSGGG